MKNYLLCLLTSITLFTTFLFLHLFQNKNNQNSNASLISEVNSSEVLPQITKKVLVIIYNPIIASNKPLVQYKKYYDPVAVQTQFIADLLSDSHNYIKYQIVDTKNVQAFPEKKSGYKFTPETYLGCLANSEPTHCEEGISYEKLNQEYSLCNRVKNNEIDEVWLWGGPWFGFYEWAFIGPRPLSQMDTVASCEKRFTVMGFNYEYPSINMMHDYGHRAESIMTNIYGNYPYALNYDIHNPWNRFWLYENIAPGNASCGFIHYPPNRTLADSYDDSVTVPVKCEDWLNYPSTTGNKMPINCTSWGCHQDISRFWLSHLPHKPGTTDGIYNNWWKYVIDYDNSINNSRYDTEKWYMVNYGEHDLNTNCGSNVNDPNILLGKSGLCSSGYTAEYKYFDIQIPKNTQINQAYLELVTDDSSNTPLTQNIMLTSGSFNSANLVWNVNDTWSEKSIVRTPDISALVQQVINNPNWTHGNSIAVKIIYSTGSGTRKLLSFDKEPQAGARLVIKTGALSFPSSEIESFANLSSTLKLNEANFYFSYTKHFSNFNLEMANTADFSAGIYLNFGSGSTSPITVTDPAKWDKYVCGAKLWWRVISSTNVISPIQSGIVCSEPPLQLAPVSSEQHAPATPLFDFTDITNRKSYTLQVAKDVSFATPVINNSTLTSSQFTPTTALSKGITYYWRVRTNYLSGSSSWSPVWSFRTASPPSVPVLVSPASASLSKVNVVLFKWNASTNSPTSYQLQIASDTSFSSPLVFDTPTLSQSVTLTSGNTYYWRVKSVNNQGDWSNWSTVRTLKVAYTPITLSSPLNTTPTILRPKFDWSNGAGDGITGYSLQTSVYANFSTLGLNLTKLASSEYQPVADLPAGKTLYWRVQVVGAYGPSDWTTGSFSTPKPPSIPTLVSPLSSTTAATQRTPIFKWNRSTVASGITLSSYELQVDDNADFSSPVIKTTLTPPATTPVTYTPTSPLPVTSPSTLYYWRVRSSNSLSQTSSWSAVWKYAVK